MDVFKLADCRIND